MELKYGAIVRTRTTDADYFWVGPDPTEWWIDGWGGSLLRREPCLLRQSSSRGGRVLITGIQSNRRDGSTSQTRIRYDITFTPSADGRLSSLQVQSIIREWWKQRHLGQHEAWPLGRELDTGLATAAAQAGKTTDALLESRSMEATAEPLVRVANAKALPPLRPATAPDSLDWVGADWPGVESMLTGASPLSVAYFAATTPAQLGDHLGLPGDVVIIVDGDDGLHARPKPAAPVSNPGQGPTRHGRRSPVPKLLLIAVGAGVVIVAVYLVVRGLSGRE